MKSSNTTHALPTTTTTTGACHDVTRNAAHACEHIYAMELYYPYHINA